MSVRIRSIKYNQWQRVFPQYHSDKFFDKAESYWELVAAELAIPEAALYYEERTWNSAFLGQIEAKQQSDEVFGHNNSASSPAIWNMVK